MTQQKSSTDHAYDRIKALEGTQRGFHFDGNGVLTLGSGYTPIVYAGKNWKLRDYPQAIFATAGINATPAQEAALQTVRSQMQKPGGLTAQEQKAALSALSGIKLTEAQNDALVRPLIKAAEQEVEGGLGQKAMANLDPRQKAELAVAAYQSPARFKDAARDLKAHAEIGDHGGLATRFAAIGKGLNDPSRYDSGAAILRDPTLKGKAIVGNGQVLGQIAQANGTTVADIMKANPHLSDPNKVRAGAVLNLPPAAGGAEPPSDDIDGHSQGAFIGTGDADRAADDAERGAGMLNEETSRDDGTKHAAVPAESPEVSKFKANLMPSEKEGARAELLYKSADQLTNDEVTDLGHWFHDLQPSDPMRAVLDRKRRDFYSLTYGDDPAKTDATGRMIEPMAKRPIPEQPTPAKSASGGTLIDGIRRIADGLANVADTDGEGEAVKALQTGLNLAGQSLTVDGIAGPKTRAGLMQTLAEKGSGKTEELAALGRLKRFAENERAGWPGIGA